MVIQSYNTIQPQQPDDAIVCPSPATSEANTDDGENVCGKFRQAPVYKLN